MALCLFTSGLGEPAAPKLETRQPRSIYELLYSFEHTFKNILSAEQWNLYRKNGPEDIRRTDPELYYRISEDVRAWTDLWIHHVRTNIVPISEKRLNTAHQKAGQVDAILKAHFEARGWPYKTLRAVFLPPQVFLDERPVHSLLPGGLFCLGRLAGAAGAGSHA